MPSFSRKWFNPLYFILKDIFKDDSVRTVFVYGGKSSSKTVSICQLLMMEAFMRDASSIAFRKQGNIIQTTLKKSFNTALKTTRLSNGFESLDFKYRTPSAEIVMKGLDDEEKTKGIESYKYVYLDEINHFEHGEYKSFNISLRGMVGQKIIGSWNPVDENSWIKKEVIDKHDWVDTEYKLPSEYSFVKKSGNGKIVLIKTDYKDNYWVTGSPCGTYGFRDQNLIDEYESLKGFDLNSYNVNVLGLWGEIKAGDSPFAFQYDESKHVSDTPEYDPKKELIISVDFNLQPFCVTFSHIWHDSEGWHDHQFDEAEIKQGSIPAMIDLIKSRYSHSLSNAVITGDAMGNRGEISQRDNASLYLQLMRGLGLRESQLKCSNNPTHENSKTDVNYSLYHFEDFKIHSKCTGTRYDMRNVQVDMYGKIVKRDRNDVNQRADYLDTVRYKVHNLHHKFRASKLRR